MAQVLFHHRAVRSRRCNSHFSQLGSREAASIDSLAESLTIFEASYYRKLYRTYHRLRLVCHTSRRMRRSLRSEPSGGP